MEGVGKGLRSAKDLQRLMMVMMMIFCSIILLIVSLVISAEIFIFFHVGDIVCIQLKKLMNYCKF